MKFYQSLEAKLTMSFFIMILTVSGVAFFFTISSAQTALKETLQEEVKALAAVAATSIDGDQHVSLNAGDEEKEEFLEIRDQIHKIQESHPDILYVYTYAKYGDDLTVFIVDAEYGFEDDSAMIGEVYPDTTPVMLNSFVDYPTAETDYVSDRWGTYLSGYAPIKNSKGEIVAALGVDMSIETVLVKQNFIGNTIYWIVGLSLLIAVLIISFYSATLSKDIKKLNQLALDVSLGKIEEDVDVSRTDEIGQLASSFQRMITSLRILRMYPDDKKKKDGQ